VYAYLTISDGKYGSTSVSNNDNTSSSDVHLSRSRISSSFSFLRSIELDNGFDHSFENRCSYRYTDNESFIDYVLNMFIDNSLNDPVKNLSFVCHGYTSRFR